MPTLTAKQGFDTHARSVAPTKEFSDSKGLLLEGANGYAYIMIKSPAPAGSVITSAKLRVYAKGASTGARTLTAKRITESWSAKRLNWNNKPAVAASGATAAVSTLADEDMIEFDVLADLQAIGGGSQNYGWRIESTTTTAWKLHAFDSAGPSPRLVVGYEVAPAAPVNLRPSSGKVSVAQPTLSWDLGVTGQASYQVQADAAMNTSTPAYDSGEISSDSTAHALNGTTFAQLGSSPSTTYWRVRIRSAGGQLSAWSDWAQVSRLNKATLAITSPTNGGNVFEPTPPMVWTFTGATQAQLQVLITPQSDRSQILYDSGVVTSATLQHTLPAAVGKNRRQLIVSGISYSVCVRVWDTATDRQGSAATGDEPYAETWANFTLSDDNTVTAPTLASAVQDGSTPLVLLTFSRSSAPDSFVIVRDGVEIAADLLPSDLTTGGTNYAWRDPSAIPGQSYSYTVRAVVNSRQSLKSNAVAFSGTKIEGLWVIDTETLKYFVLSGVDAGSWKHQDVVSQYLPLGARAAFAITQSLGGLGGSFGGLLRERDFRTVAAMVADLWRIKERATYNEMRLVVDQISLPVQIINLTCAPTEESVAGYPRYAVSFDFWQVNEFAYQGRV